MAYRNKTYVCFDGDTDMHYYRMMLAWVESDKVSFDFYNAHDLNTARDTSQEESIKRQLRERLANSKLMIVLIGEKTRFLRKFVQWEMESALRLDMPIIGVNLNGSRVRTSECPAAIKDELVIYVPFGAKIIEYAMNNWPESYKRHQTNGDTGPYNYKESVYKELNI
ncbi:TIR domain-containing protein [Microbaculum sp. FT89]|uniref:TIR domain-containing protein n=1 Tax=Microbaculum sp. FT89 TaxID=3447298 RepID=UPI003F532B80